MLSVILCGICIALWITMGFIYYFDGRANKQELRVTPFSARSSWTMFAMILVQFLFDFAEAIALMGGK